MTRLQDQLDRESNGETWVPLWASKYRADGWIVELGHSWTITQGGFGVTWEYDPHRTFFAGIHLGPLYVGLSAVSYRKPRP
jgi:hypothetical protein